MATPASRKAKGFASIQDATQGPVNAPASTSPQAVPSTPAPGPPAPAAPAAPATAAAPQEQAPESHPVYDSQEGEDPDAGHAHLMHDLGTAIQDMMAKDPQTNKSMADLMDQFMGSGVDYDSESKRLRGMIDARKTPKAPNWVAAGVGSWAGGPDVANKFQALQQAATGAQAKKESDKENLESQLLGEHVQDLRARGKTKEALLMGLMNAVAGQKKVETQLEGRKELQERALGAAAERVRMRIAGTAGVKDKDRTAQMVMHMYETLLKQTQKDITGETKPLYSADEAMGEALNSILPKVKPGVTAVKTGKTPPPAEGEAPQQQPAPSKQSKFAQWKASQATRK